jgi:hypothetical protein
LRWNFVKDSTILSVVPVVHPIQLPKTIEEASLNAVCFYPEGCFETTVGQYPFFQVRLRILASRFLISWPENGTLREVSGEKLVRYGSDSADLQVYFTVRLGKSNVLHAAACLQTDSTLITNDKRFDKLQEEGIVEVWSISQAIERFTRRRKANHDN